MNGMSKTKKGLGDSIWAARGKAQPLYKYQSNQYHSSIITPATPRPPSPVKNGAYRPATTTSTSGTATPNSHDSGNTNTNATSSHAPRPSGGPSAQQEFKRYIQIVRRLKWKLPYLSHGYHHAIARPESPLYGGETDAEEAELMFKLDFYEYYMLLERALVHLMGVFGITISRDGWVTTTSTTRQGNGTQRATHTYHRNVIAALEKEDNPLHGALGSGEVVFQLLRAKELRNRWKYAEDPADPDGNGSGNGGAGRGAVAGGRGSMAARERAGTAPLESYDLDRIFRYIFAGFDAGYAVAEQWVQAEMGAGSGGGGGAGGGGAGGGVVEMEEDEFDFMVEAMDWEAV
ncbi:hypothetical protein CABS01_01062 [Colletotrichum abscissum]|uniref:Fungal specific transcription factor n=1 Tax=Colletotrichum abscissum TaxID=1671311 RepID=A0A9P9XIF2_9PEZI|nr:uncharacterized protein CABS01_01062 [Colletotrichum abscissum]KAI3554369.1 hypothetical protein CABS02_05500 [Colletotrichum abscissum]KAK1505594.1 hypothetical protein CABS01_01062 [Colletotrichum abscissum]